MPCDCQLGLPARRSPRRSRQSTDGPGRARHAAAPAACASGGGGISVASALKSSSTPWPQRKKTCRPSAARSAQARARRHRTLPRLRDRRHRARIRGWRRVSPLPYPHATAIFCRSTSRAMPFLASAISAANCSSLNGSPSAVPWTSTMPPLAGHDEIGVGAGRGILEHSRGRSPAGRRRCRRRSRRHGPSAPSTPWSSAALPSRRGSRAARSSRR